MKKIMISSALFLILFSSPSFSNTEGELAFQQKDYATALKFWRPLSEKGDATAAYYLGIMFSNGLGVEQDFAKAMMWFRKAANPDMENKLNEYIEFVTMGLSATYPILAEEAIGTLFLDGNGVRKDVIEAEKWCKKAADKGSSNALICLGRVQIEKGSFEEAMKLLRTAASKGSIAGMQLLYSSYHTVKDYTQAIKWAREAAKHGDFKALHYLGGSYFKGQGVPQDYVLAHKCWNLSASLAPSSEEGRKDSAAALRDMVAKMMTAEQVAEAQKLAREWKPG